MKPDEDEILAEDEVQARMNARAREMMEELYPGLLTGAEEFLAKRAAREAAKNDPTSPDFSDEDPAPTPPPPVDPVALLARERRERELMAMALALHVKPEAVVDWCARMDPAKRGPSLIDPTSDLASDAEQAEIVRQAAPHLFTGSPSAAPAGPRDPW